MVTIRYRRILLLLSLPIIGLFGSWGFYGHKKINQLAVFTLPPGMIGFFKKNLQYITDASVNPDRRRYSVVDEAPRHYIDLDHYGDSAWVKLPRHWRDAVALYSEDTLKAHGILPWHVVRMHQQLREAFMLRDPQKILRLSAELGHYIADAHVPLHTTKNYNGQLTGQEGIHAFWESRLPELFSHRYDFWVGKAEYIPSPQDRIWAVIASTHLAVDSVLVEEKKLSQRFGERKFAFETKGKQTVRVYSAEYAKAYDKVLAGMVERQMRKSIKTIGDFWYTAWIDAGQPDLKTLLEHTPSAEELEQRKKELEEWKKEQYTVRSHESGE